MTKDKNKLNKTIKWKVAISDSELNKVSQSIFTELKKQCEVTFWHKPTRPTKEEFIKLIAGKQAVLCFDVVDREIIERSPDLKIIANNAVGFDKIDLQAAKEHGIVVTNTPGVLNQSVAEHTFSLIMTITKRIVEGHNAIIKTKLTSPNKLVFGIELKNKTLGIIGLGRIGREVARIASKGFGMQVLYHSSHRDIQIERETVAKYTSKEKLLKNSDFVSLHVPLTPDTHYLIGTKELQLMQKSAYLINTSRGPVVDEKALVAALKKKLIAGAALDVFEFEPKLSPGLTKLSNVVLTPHIASATIDARTAMAKLAIDNILAVKNGKPPITPVKIE